MRKLRWWERSVKKVTGGLSEVAERLVRDFVVGSVLAGTTILSGIARKLRSDKRGFEAGLERLSRGFKYQGGAIAEACRVYRRRVGQVMRRHGLDVVAIDLSEIVKPYGRKMQYLCEVRDGSKSSELKKVLEKGWWTVEVAATQRDSHRVVPLLRHAYSTVHPDFKSEQHELRRAFEQIAPALPRGIGAVLDRGFDGESYFSLLEDFFPSWAVRQRGDRQVYLAGQDQPERMSTLAKTVPTVHEARPTVVRRDELVHQTVKFGYVTVEVPRHTARRTQRKPPCRTMTLIVAERVHPRDELPMMLLVSGPVRIAVQARQWVEAYFRRWGAEDETRGGKQLGGLEDLRVMSWESVYNLVALSVVVEGLVALLQFENPRRAARLAERAPIDGEVPAYALYRLWMSVSLLLEGRRLDR